jgi:thioredoxin 1
MAISKVTDADFEQEVLQSSKPVLVDFWAEWCGPCKQLAPALDDISESFSDELEVAKLNVDENPTTPMKWNVRGLPTLLLFKDGKVVSNYVGVAPKRDLEDWLRQSLS